MDDVAAMGRRVRELRGARGLTLAGLAGLSGVSRSMLSEVERGTRTPTVVVLDRIATALGTSIARLLRDEAPQPTVLLRRDDQDVARDRSGWERRILSPVLPGVEFEFMRTTLGPGVDAGRFTPHAAGSREFVAVESGELCLTLDDEPYSLAAGDALSYRGDCRHAFANQGATDCVYYLVMVLGEAFPNQHHVEAGATVDEVRRAAVRAAELAADHLGSVRAGAWQPMRTGDLEWLTGQELPVSGRPLAGLVEDVRERVLRYPMGNGHPRFFGWVNSPPSPAGVVVEPLAAALNPSCAGGEHAGVLLERTVLRWLAELVGYPHRPGGGLLTSGASMATIICLAAARQRAAQQDGWDVRADGLSGRPPLVGYVSAEGHSCVRKAAELLGLGSRSLRTIPVDRRFRMDTAALRAAIHADRDGSGGGGVPVRPFFVAASAGTVNTGAVDPLAEIADIASQNGLWFHVDGAYGALGVLIRHSTVDFTGMRRADSLALDPHKWLGVPVDCGCALVADPALLRDTFSLVPTYLRDDAGDELGWFAEYGPEQTRPFRALRAWATMAHLGREGIVALVNHTAGLARTLAAMIEDAADFELLAPVVTSTTAFRYRRTGADLDELNRGLPAAVQRRGRVFLTGTRLADQEALRACILNPATTEADLAVLLDEIRAAAQG